MLIRRRAPTRVDFDIPSGINLGIGAAFVVCAVLVAALIPPVHGYWRLGLVAATVAAFATLTVDRLALLGVAQRTRQDLAGWR